MKYKVWINLFLIIGTICVLNSCKGGGLYQPNVSGGAFEVLLVIDQDIYQSDAGRAIFDVLTSDVEHLPQAEPQFSISRIQHSMFDDLLKTTRNIVFVSVDSTQYTIPKISMVRNQWAKTQAIINITSPSCEEIAPIITNNSSKIINYFVKAERERMMSYYRANINKEALNMVVEQFGCKVALPTSLNKYKTGDNFFWASNCSGTVRQDVIIYSEPYRSELQLTPENILARRDSVLKVNLNGGVEGSYMGTEYRYEPPTTQVVKYLGKWSAETRGLWKMIDGECMGGPFVSLTRIDEINHKIITIEGFVFAPSKEKRNYLRQMDAMVYSLLLPEEINGIEITVTK